MKGMAGNDNEDGPSLQSTTNIDIIIDGKRLNDDN